jgi:hypothetical protein
MPGEVLYWIAARAPRAAALAVAASVLAVGLAALVQVAGAQSPGYGFGELGVLYQHYDFLGANRDLWTTTFSYGRAQQFGALNTSAEFRLYDQRSVNSPERTFRPEVNLRAAHPFWGMTALYRPTTTTYSSFFGTPGTLQSHQNESQLSAYFARPGLPRVDGSWDRRRLESGYILSAGISTNRSLHAVWTRDILEFRGGLGDLRTENEGGDQTSSQNTWNAGASVRVEQNPRHGFSVNYDLNSLRQSGRGFTYSQNLNHHLDVTGRYEPVRRTQLTGFAQLTRSRLTNQTEVWVTSKEAMVSGSYQPNQAATFYVTTGLRPGAGALTGETQKYVTASAAIQGRVRPGWTGVAGVNQSWTWDGRSFRIGSYHVGSRFVPFYGMDLNLDATVSDNGDTAVAGQQVSSTGLVYLTLQPLRNIQLSYNVTGYRSGPDVWTPAASTSTNSWSVRWQVVPQVDLLGSSARTGSLAFGAPDLRTRQAQVRWIPSSHVQTTLNYAQSDASRPANGVGGIGGRETWRGELAALLSARWRLNMSGSWADPGKATRSRQVDVSLSTRLGG